MQKSITECMKIICQFLQLTGLSVNHVTDEVCFLFSNIHKHSWDGAVDANFHVLGSEEWNRLPDSIKTITSKARLQ